MKFKNGSEISIPDRAIEIAYYCPFTDKIMVWTNKINGHTMSFWFFECQGGYFDVYTARTEKLIKLGEL